jgi:hypothetical protein
MVGSKGRKLANKKYIFTYLYIQVNNKLLRMEGEAKGNWSLK